MLLLYGSPEAPISFVRPWETLAWHGWPSIPHDWGKRLLGYGLVFGLYVAFTPFCLFVPGRSYQMIEESLYLCIYKDNQKRFPRWSKTMWWCEWLWVAEACEAFARWPHSYFCNMLIQSVSLRGKLRWRTWRPRWTWAPFRACGLPLGLGSVMVSESSACQVPGFDFWFGRLRISAIFLSLSKFSSLWAREVGNGWKTLIPC